MKRIALTVLILSLCFVGQVFADTEGDLFPVTSGHATYGTTLRLYKFQGATEAAVGDDLSIYASDLENYSTTPPLYQQQGYGDEVKSDGTDEAIASSVFGVSGLDEDYMLESVANTTHSDTSEMTIECIVMIDDWVPASNSWNLAYSTFIGDTGGYELAIGHSSPIHFQGRFEGSGAGSGRYERIGSAGITISDGDWVYTALVWDDSQTGNDKIAMYAGNLTSPSANMFAATDGVGDGTAAFVANNVKLGVFNRETMNIGLNRGGNHVSVLRIQDKAFSSATVETRYDEIKEWGTTSGVFKFLGEGRFEAK